MEERRKLIEWFRERIASLPEDERRPYIIMSEICQKQLNELLEIKRLQTYSIKESTSVS